MIEFVRSVGKDLRYGLRNIAANPGFTVVAVLSLALGIGANTAIFSMIDAVLLRSLPVERPAELVSLASGNSRGFFDGTPSGTWELFSYPYYKDLRDRNEVFSDVMAFSSLTTRLNLGSTSGPVAGTGAGVDRVEGLLVSGNYFQVLGLHARAGRLLTTDDDREPGGHPVAVISEGFWHRRYASDPGVVGTPVRLNGHEYTILGVAPAGFKGIRQGDEVDVFLPLAMQTQTMRQDDLLNQRALGWLHLMGRLKPGVSMQKAQANIDVLLLALMNENIDARTRPEDANLMRASRIVLQPGNRGFSDLRRTFTQPLYLLMALVALVLLIACANVANLLLARAAARQREISVRTALGAGRWRLLRQLLTESIVLSVMGGAAGLLLAFWGVHWLAVTVARGDTPAVEFTPDLRVLSFTLGVSLLTGILFGLVPALRATRSDLSGSLKERAGAAKGSTSRIGLSKLLVVSQVAMSMLLLVGAGLFIRSVNNLRNLDLGFQRENLVMLRTDLRGVGYTEARLPQFYRSVLDSLKSVPGVRYATFSLTPLLSGEQRSETISAADGFSVRAGEEPAFMIGVVTPEYMRTTGMRLVSGSDFPTEPITGGARVAIVNEASSRFLWGDQSPLGKNIVFGDGDQRRSYQIIGLVADARYNNVRETSRRAVFIPAESTEYLGVMMVRTAEDPASLLPRLRQAVKTVDPELPLFAERTLEMQLERSITTDRLIARLSAFFGGVALLLACVGLFGVMQYGVVQRTNEIGIRMALGARRWGVLWMVLKETVLLVVAGVVMGLPMALLSGRLIASLLFGTGAADPLALAAAVTLMTVVALLAGYLPARRAANVDPMVALRYE